jgi:hypothetical protein
MLGVAMRTKWIGLSMMCAALAAGCGGGGGGSETGGQTEGQTTGNDTCGPNNPTCPTPTDGVASGSETESAEGGVTEGGTCTQGDPPCTNPGETTATLTEPDPGTDSNTGDTTATTDPTADTSTGPGETTEGTDTVGTTVDPDTTMGVDDTSSGEESTTNDCVPALEVCNDLDDDCNGVVDDLDAGGDGICDCLSIALVGNQGANPSAEFQAWLEMQGTQVDRIHTNANEPMTPAVLANYDILILDWMVRNYTAQEAADVRTWIEQGGGLMSLTGHVNNNTVIDRPNSLLGPMGLTYNGSKGFFSGPIVNFSPHPITMGLTSISFFGGLYIDIAPDGVGVNETIMTLPQGPVGVVQERKEGHVFVFGDEWVEFDSEWQNIPQIKQFWVQSLQWLSPQGLCYKPQ